MNKPSDSPIVPSIEPTLEQSTIKLEQLSNVSAISALGLVAARVLQQHGIVILMIGADGTVEMVPFDELRLDSLTESDALHALIQSNYTDEQMQSYLQQREVRLTRRKG